MAVETLPLTPEFETTFAGQVVRAGHPDYDELRHVRNAMFDRRPAIIARCTGVADVIAAVNYARTHDLRVAVRAGNHSSVGYGSCDDGMVIDLSPMKGIWVDPLMRTARVQAGATWAELDRETSQFGLAVTGGRISTTGVAGLALGSGSGWLERKFGLTADSITAVDVVTAAGDLVRASDEENADLFWGIRGGGGNFGIVTSFDFKLHEVGPIVYGGLLLYEADQAHEVLTFYRDFMRDAVPEVGTGFAFLTFRDQPFIPPELQGKPGFGIFFCYAGDVAEGERVMAPLRDCGTPVVDLLGPIPYTMLQTLLDRGFPDRMRSYSKAEFVTELTDDLIEGIIRECREIPSPWTVMLLEPLGGAINDIGEDETALSRPAAHYVFHALNVWPDVQDDEANISWVRRFADMIAPFTTPGVYLNFTSDEGEARVRGTYGPEKYARLVALKDKYDPDNFFRLNQNIRPSRAT